jgi:hypothetical protein
MMKGTPLMILSAIAAVFTCATLRAEEHVKPSASSDQAISISQPRIGVGWDDGVALRIRLGSRWGFGLRVNPDLVDSEASTEASYSYQQTRDDYPIWKAEPSWSWSSTYRSSSDQDDDTKTLAFSAMLYYERDFGRWFAAGPYLGLSYTRRTGDRTKQIEYFSRWKNEYPDSQSSSEQTQTADIATELWERDLGIEVGVRPVLQLHRHVALETRFGIEVVCAKWREKGHEQHEWDSSDDLSRGVVLADAGAPSPPSIVVPEPSIRGTGGSGHGAADWDYENSGSSTRWHAIGDRVLSDVQIRLIVYF